MRNGMQWNGFELKQVGRYQGKFSWLQANAATNKMNTRTAVVEFLHDSSNFDAVLYSERRRPNLLVDSRKLAREGTTIVVYSRL